MHTYVGGALGTTKTLHVYNISPLKLASRASLLRNAFIAATIFRLLNSGFKLH